ncbi:MAG TPA: CoA-acylating methylmalonate-semialdehyde dehydrogenase [Candidatus Baltobacteraceae bacterium]|jgi:malonate-semialdehyde dehydrogenase (acetylating)/methylmalonate-semialdehyde dehydrogenase|nr:CoA-acylating methylmalonate-semialdehyde dehydrogenase [Candidatus Baltobacteraceae bacterium]
MDMLVTDPATGLELGSVVVAQSDDVARTVAVARKAFASWSQVPVVERARSMFRYADALERRHEEIARSVSRENGKTIADARGEARRGIEAVEFACGMPSLMMGDALPDVARGVDSISVRYPLGVCAGITPFNFPSMIPLWMFPIAIAAGNTFVLKPSPQTPLTAELLAETAREAQFPEGVLNVVHGGVDTVNALIDHPEVAAVSFVGSSSVAQLVHERAVRAHKRVQALGGAKNFLIVMPDGVKQSTIDAIMSSAFGGAGQRCLAGSVAIAVGGAADALVPMLVDAARGLRLGCGLDAGTDMGPVISNDAIARIDGYVERAQKSGATMVLPPDPSARDAKGSFLPPVIFDRVDPQSELAREEIFGPVLAVVRVATLGEAIDLANRSRYGNASSIFTSDGGSARTFSNRIEVGMVGVNIGVAAPMSFFPFGGVKDSIFGDLRCHGKDGVAFYTQQRVVISRWT